LKYEYIYFSTNNERIKKTHTHKTKSTWKERKGMEKSLLLEIEFKCIFFPLLFIAVACSRKWEWDMPGVERVEWC